MFDQVKELLIKLDEEVKYHQNIMAHKSSLESTLWGLEEQMRLPENSSKEDQEEINTQINQCRTKILNCKKLIESHKFKVFKFINEYKVTNSSNRDIPPDVSDE
jgi:protein subunit release factor B